MGKSRGGLTTVNGGEIIYRRGGVKCTKGLDGSLSP